VKTTFKVEGLSDLDKRLGQLTEAAGKGVLRRTGRKALAPTDAAWRSKAPHLTGQLEESGGVGSKLTRSQRKAQERESFVEVFAGPGPNPQAVLQEFGTYNQPAQPFLRPAWDETKDQVLDIVKTELASEIDKAAKRAAKKAAKLAGG
jgi:HK97 gp10 family phage protein